MLAAALRHAGKARANFHTLDGVDAHHGVGNVGIELVKQRLPRPTGMPCAVTRNAGPA
jgi:hypothetical protein